MNPKDETREDPANLRKRAEAAAEADKSILPESMLPEDTGRILQELRVHQVELQMQNEELRRAQVELDAARAQYFDLYDLAPVGYLTVSETGLILEANFTAARLLGVERSALVKRRLASFIFREDADIYYLHHKQLQEAGLRQVSEVRLQRSDGAQFWACVEAVKAESAAGAPVFRVVISDITARKRTEEALHESEEQLGTIFQDAPLMMMLVDAERRIRKANRLVERFTGLSEAGLIGQRDGEGLRCVYSLDSPNGCGFAPHCETCLVRLTVLDTLTTGCGHEQVEANLPFMIAGKSQELFLLLSTAGLNIRGSPHALLTIQDISERKGMEKALRVSKEHLQLLIEYAPVALAMFDSEMRYLHVSRRWLSDYGLGDRELRGLSHYEVFPEIPERWKLAHRCGLAGEVLRDESDRFDRADGSVQRIRWEIRPWRGAAGRVDGIVIFTEEITERKRTEELLLRSEKLASVGRMAASIAHEINNPLAALTNTVYLAQSSLGEPSVAQQYLQLADDELSRIAHITRQALGFYRESSTPAMVFVNPILDSALDVLRAKFVSKRVTVKKRYRGDLQVTAVAGELRQLLANLLANSLDAVEETGTIQLRVSKMTRGDGRQPCIRITVADNGTGISAAALPRIFEPLFTTKEVTGSGLGLWVSKQLLEKHHGSIRVRTRTSGKWKGTAFSVFLPAGDA
jgi:PAS domain S-box-containing protein